MSHKSPVEWVPLDFDDPFRPVTPAERHSQVTWVPLDLPQEEMLTRMPGMEGVSERVPDIFRKEAKRAWGYLEQLDRDPDTAIQEPRIRTFVDHLARSGFRGGVILHYRMRKLYKNAPDPAIALPVWLQKPFLQKHALGSSEGPSENEKEVITQAFGALVLEKPYYDGPHGRYFTISQEAVPSPRPRSFKCYVEGTVLLQAFQNGSLEGAFAMLEHLPLGLTCKLFEGDRLVIYGAGDVKNYADVEDIFSMCGVALRGPAQDTWSVNADKKMGLEVERSNDQSLGDGGGVPDALEYPLSVYEREGFFRAYIRLCAYSGKSPSDPYLTSFVATYCKTGSAEERKRVMQEATALTGYPTVLVESFHELARL